MLDGGQGLDTLSYSQRTRGVVVDLATHDPVGEPGERDIASGFEHVTGGEGDDRLAGNDGANQLDGRGGSNLVIGRGGNDFLLKASGPAVRCGSGSDHVLGTRARTIVAPSCERLSIRLPRHANVDGGAVVNPIPLRAGGAFGFPLECPETDGYPEDCRTTVRIVARSNHRRLATGELDNSGSPEGPEGRFLRVHLTAFGRALYGDRRRQLATVVARGPLMARTAWTIWF
jgi:Ca2+-binding RTX toxin-like protein